MANKELTAKIKLDSSDAESKLRRLESLIKSINKAVTGHANTSQLETKLSKQLIATEKVKQATLKTQIAQEKLNQEIGRSFVAEERVSQAVAKTAVEQEKAKQAVSKTRQEIGKEFVAEERVNQALAKTAIAQEKVKQATSKTAQEIGKEFIAEEKVNQALIKTQRLTEQVHKSTNKSSAEAKKLSDAFKSGNTHANALLTTVKRLAATYLGVMGMKAIVTQSDSITSAQNRLNNLEGGNPNLTQASMDKMYAAAQRSRSGYNDMLGNVSKTMTLAGGAFKGDIDNAIRFQEIMAKAYTVGGASDAEKSSSMYQLVQALGSGVLQGDELRSVREGAPIAYKEIEKFCQGVLDTDKSLKDLASQGVVTSDMVVAAIMNAETKISDSFDNTQITFGQAWTRIKNTAIKAFEPVAQRLTDMLNKAAESGIFEKIENAFWNISKVLQIVFTVIENTIMWMADNWNWLKHVVVGALILITAYLLMEAGIAVACAYEKMKAWFMANMEMFKTVAIIAIVIAAVLTLLYIFYLWKTGAIDTCQAIVSALLVVGIAVALIGLLIGSWIVVIVGLVIAAIGLIVNWLDYFLAVVYSVGAFIYNLVVGVINAIIQLIWAMFVEPFIGIIEYILNCCMGGFDSFGGAVANLIGNIISWFLSLGQVVTKIIDAIFGTNWTGGLESLKDKVLQWGKSENSITLNREAPQLNRMAYGDAWNTGMNHGSVAKDWLGGLGSKFQTGGNGLGIDKLGEKLGLNFGDGLLGSGASGLNPSSGYDPSKLLGDIADDTGSMADSMNLTQEDLEYLRKVADMEWKKEFTTASITVDMSNYNTISGENDLDGIVEKLADKLYDEMNAVANGVYA